MYRCACLSAANILIHAGMPVGVKHMACVSKCQNVHVCSCGCLCRCASEDSAGRLRTGHSAPRIWTPFAAPVAGARAAVQAGRNSEKREERESSLWQRETEHLCVRKPMDDQMVYWGMHFDAPLFKPMDDQMVY